MTSSLPKSVFITGATGFIGSHIARRYLAEGYTVCALKRPESSYGMLSDVANRISWHEGDVLDIPSLELAILPDMDVIHTAAMVSFVPKDRRQMERINVEGTANIVNVCLKTGVRKLGYLSSVAALGRPVAKGEKPMNGTPVVIDENQKWEESPNNSAYAQTKYRAELEVWRGIAEGLNAVMVNPSIVLGAGDWTRSSLQLLKYAYDEKPFYPAGLMNYVDVLDVTDALFGLMQSDITGQRYILNGGTIPYRSLLEQVATILGKRPPSIQVPPLLTQVMWPLEAIRSWITGKAPLITRETARSASSLYQFNGHRIEQLPGFQYRPLSETLQRVADAFNQSPVGA
ncbi:NAD-dependent epimerase/dehydratase family protein [Spirosoma sp. KUDC1026]|uniref:NAD-dependent epimerase/dehydratase family protein n=1 Tax=Spirosoma sp. KUDC1026 TaxID=2745947 RepID=UPI00159BB952|nr:NAD-dependent epimerase/dehydratase family protein [Spirosoma sp. KUDC1026]QKZ15016.1 NAD-dependent epimerase/dehydratase family protein [Spirosoma sp. KUDC1026]